MTAEQDVLLQQLAARVNELRAEVAELRVETSELEATVAELAARPDRIELPWPIPLLLLPAAAVLALVRQVQQLAQALAAESAAPSREVATRAGDPGRHRLSAPSAANCPKNGDERVSHRWETRPHARE